MKRTEEVYREILHQAEEGNNILTQKAISDKLSLSLSNVSNALKPLRRMNAIAVKKMCFHIVNPRKIAARFGCICSLFRLQAKIQRISCRLLRGLCLQQ